MNLTKKQVKAWLDTMSTDEVRPVLCGATVTKYQDKTAVITTDGYKMAFLGAPELAGHEGKFISRDEIVKWYKLANSKDVLTGETLATLARETDMKFPSISPITERAAGTVAHIMFQAKYALIMEELAGYPLNWELGTSPNVPLIAHYQGDMYVLMPMR